MIPAAALALALELRREGRRRLELDAVWRAFADACPSLIGSADARAQLAAGLDALAREGRIEVPRGRVGWDRSASPPLPRWIRFAEGGRVETESIDPRTVAWAPELAFVVALGPIATLDDLLAIQRFLASGRGRPLVPLRERSVELFGDEKRLDLLRKGRLFGDGRLSLDLLRCYDVVPPLVFERAPRSARTPTLLIVENLHTYASFRRWNQVTAHYVAVAYGGGTQFLKTVRDLPRIVAEVGARDLEYFGDLDPAGLRIAIHASRVLAGEGQSLVPAARWYEVLLDRGEALVGSPADSTESTRSTSEVSFLPEPLRSRAAEILGRGRRLPQELVGWEVLEAAP